MSLPKKRKFNPVVKVPGDVVNIGQDFISMAVISAVQKMFTQGDWGLHGWAKTIGFAGAMTVASSIGRGPAGFVGRFSKKKISFSSLKVGDTVRNLGSPGWVQGVWRYVGNQGGFYRFINVTQFQKMKAFQKNMEDRIDLSQRDDEKMVDAESFKSDWSNKKSTLATPYEEYIWLAN